MENDTKAADHLVWGVNFGPRAEGEKLYARIRVAAAKRGMSISAWIREAITDALKREKG